MPDLTGKFPLGANNSHILNSTGGTESVNLKTYNLNSRAVRQATADGLTPEDFNPVNYVDLNGGGQPNNNMPPYFALNFIIKYK